MDYSHRIHFTRSISLLSTTKPSKKKFATREKMAAGERTAFFYGTLMVPEVLHRVLSLPSTTHLKVHPAILPEHSRHHVRYADYPGMIPNPNSRVRGTYVTGLTDRDIGRLDLFEGSQYKRVKVLVWKLTLADDSGDGGSNNNKEEGKVVGGSTGALGDGNGEERILAREHVQAETYIFKDKEDLLEKEWDFEVFKREKLDRWVGTSDEYDDLDDDEDDEDEDIEDDEDENPDEKEGKSGNLPPTNSTEEKEILESAV